MNNKDDERLRKTTISFLKYFAEQGYENAVECIDWLEKTSGTFTQKDVDDAYLKGISDTKNELEKQGESKFEQCIQEGDKIITNEDGTHFNTSQLERVAKKEPKFKVGDEIKTANEESLTITKIDNKGYWSEDLFICDFDEECLWDLVEQKPINDTDEEIVNAVKDTSVLDLVEPKFKVGDFVDKHIKI